MQKLNELTNQIKTGKSESNVHTISLRRNCSVKGAKGWETVGKNKS